HVISIFYKHEFPATKGHILAFLASWQFFFGIWGILWVFGARLSGFSAEAALQSSPRRIFISVSWWRPARLPSPYFSPSSSTYAKSVSPAPRRAICIWRLAARSSVFVTRPMLWFASVARMFERH